MSERLKFGDKLPTMPRGYKAVQEFRIGRGLHPFGLDLANNGKTCGDCKHAQGYAQAARWYKCDLMHNTGGRATDLKVRWSACVRFEEAEERGA